SFQNTEGAPAAGGTSQSDATPLTAAANSVTGADDAKGVLLPNFAGARILVHNADATHALLVYPPAGAGLTALTVNSPYVLLAGGIATFSRVSPTTWGIS